MAYNYICQDEVLNILDPDPNVQEPGLGPYANMDPQFGYSTPNAGPYANIDPQFGYVSSLNGGAYAGRQYVPGAGNGGAQAARPPAAEPPPWAPGTVGRLQLRDLSVKERIGILNQGLGATRLPDPRTVPLKGLAHPEDHAGEEAKGVKYFHKNQVQTLRDKYQVKLGANIMRRGEIFDTGRIKAFFRHRRGVGVGNRLTAAEKAKPFDRNKARALPGAALLGRDRRENAQRWGALNYEWGLEGLIWVCSLEEGQTKPSFYSHIGKIERFHHSSFKAGGGVIGAGEWIVQKGKLLKISGNSGHYQPTINHLHRSVLYMAEAWTQSTVVLLWNIPNDAWDEVPVLIFRDNPTRNGMYKAHPNEA